MADGMCGMPIGAAWCLEPTQAGSDYCPQHQHQDDALRALRDAVRTDETLDVGELWRSGLRAIQRDLEGMLEED